MGDSCLVVEVQHAASYAAHCLWGTFTCHPAPRRHNRPAHTASPSCSMIHNLTPPRMRTSLLQTVEPVLGVVRSTCRTMCPGDMHADEVTRQLAGSGYDSHNPRGWIEVCKRYVVVPPGDGKRKGERDGGALRWWVVPYWGVHS